MRERDSKRESMLLLLSHPATSFSSLWISTLWSQRLFGLQTDADITRSKKRVKHKIALDTSFFSITENHSSESLQ